MKRSIRVPLAWTGSVVVALVMAACGGRGGPASADSGGASCQCLALDISASNEALCDCPQLRFGCATAPQTFERVCDVAPQCWSVTTDPTSGCPMPAYQSPLGNAACSCVGGHLDAGVRD